MSPRKGFGWFARVVMPRWTAVSISVQDRRERPSIQPRIHKVFLVNDLSPDMKRCPGNLVGPTTGVHSITALRRECGLAWHWARRHGPGGSMSVVLTADELFERAR